MQPMTNLDLRSLFVNATLRERKNITVPENLGDLDWDNLDFLGWRDPKFTQLGYVVAPLDGEPVGIILKEAQVKRTSRPQCAWCEDVRLPNDVVFFSAKRAGPAGRNGNTVGTLVCAGFQCSSNVRLPPPLPYIGFDVAAAQVQRIANLTANAGQFVRSVRDGGQD